MNYLDKITDNLMTLNDSCNSNERFYLNNKMTWHFVIEQYNQKILIRLNNYRIWIKNSRYISD